MQPAAVPDDPRVFSAIHGLLNKAAYALQHVADAQDTVRVLCTTGADPSAVPLPTVMAKVTSAANFIASVAEWRDPSLAATSIAVCPTRMCQDPSVRE